MVFWYTMTICEELHCALKMKKIVQWKMSTLCTIFTILLTLWNLEQKNGPLIKLFCFSSDFDETCWSCSYPWPFVLQFHQVSSRSDEKQKSFVNSPFFCSEFQSVSRIMKIVHNARSSIIPIDYFALFVGIIE